MVSFTIHVAEPELRTENVLFDMGELIWATGPSKEDLIAVEFLTLASFFVYLARCVWKANTIVTIVSCLLHKRSFHQ